MGGPDNRPRCAMCGSTPDLFGPSAPSACASPATSGLFRKSFTLCATLPSLGQTLCCIRIAGREIAFVCIGHTFRFCVVHETHIYSNVTSILAVPRRNGHCATFQTRQYRGHYILCVVAQHVVRLVSTCPYMYGCLPHHSQALGTCGWWSYSLACVFLYMSHILSTACLRGMYWNEDRHHIASTSEESTRIVRNIRAWKYKQWTSKVAKGRTKIGLGGNQCVCSTDASVLWKWSAPTCNHKVRSVNRGAIYLLSMYVVELR